MPIGACPGGYASALRNADVGRNVVMFAQRVCRPLPLHFHHLSNFDSA